MFGTSNHSMATKLQDPMAITCQQCCRGWRDTGGPEDASLLMDSRFISPLKFLFYTYVEHM